MGTDYIVENLGPLARLAGTWQGEKGLDRAPSPSRELAETKFHEKMTFEPFGPVDNHEQTLWGLRYSTAVWRPTDGSGFHEDHGYFLWDPARKTVMRCSVVPRGVVFIAGGHAEATSSELKLVAERGSTTFGICANPFLDEVFRTERFEMKIAFAADGASFSYTQDTVLHMKGREDLFHHVDENTLRRV